MVATSRRARQLAAWKPFVLLLVSSMTGSGCSSATDQQRLAAYDPYSVPSQVDQRFEELPLGSFFVSFPDLDTGATTVMNARLVGVVPQRYRADFRHAFSQRRQVMRSNVRQILQEFDVTDQSPRAIDQLKSRLVSEVRRSLRTDSIEEIVFTDFTVE